MRRLVAPPGARALLVSHWAVASQATVALTTRTFEAQAKDPTLGRAEALRRAQLSLAGDRNTAHPFYWAPFVLVGDGGAPARP
jgi:CHAT domain-containing protein